MKEVIIFIVGILIGTRCVAQTFPEWFHQKRTQIKYLKQQIAALKAYKDIVTKGYHIIAEGLDNIREIDEEDKNLHSDHFNFLLFVNPEILNDARVAAIRDLSGKIRKMVLEYEQLVIQFKPDFSNEATHIRKEMETTCSDLEDYLKQLITDGGFRMTDDERLEILEKLYKRTKSLYKSSARFLNELKAGITK